MTPDKCKSQRTIQVTGQCNERTFSHHPTTDKDEREDNVKEADESKFVRTAPGNDASVRARSGWVVRIEVFRVICAFFFQYIFFRECSDLDYDGIECATEDVRL